jgi:hypothetical protein
MPTPCVLAAVAGCPSLSCGPCPQAISSYIFSYDTRVGFDTPAATATAATARNVTVPASNLLALPAENAAFYVLTVPTGVRVYVHVVAANSVGSSPPTPLVGPSYTQVSITARQAPAAPAAVTVTAVRAAVRALCAGGGSHHCLVGEPSVCRDLALPIPMISRRVFGGGGGGRGLAVSKAPTWVCLCPVCS